MADRTGQELGNYRLTRLLGRGGFAEVYLGEHMRLKTQAAIKVLYAQLDSDNSEEFLQEAQTVAHLIHPNIVRIFDFDVKEGVPFLVMDYAPSGTLRQRHPKKTRLSLETIIPYIKQVADALQYAHDEKFIHRDIKPENMLIGRRGEILLSDFGIALIAQSTHMQSTQAVMGTAYYMAPEQLQGKPRLASDQYALGVVVYEWLTGTRPFTGSFSEIASQHMFVSPAPLREKLPGLSSAVEEVVMTTLAKDPHQRFGSVRAFANALEQAGQSHDALTFIRPSAQLSVPISLVQSPIMPVQPSQQMQPVQLPTSLSTSQFGPIIAPSLIPSPFPDNMSQSTELETSPGQNLSTASSKQVKMPDKTLPSSVQFPSRQRVSQPIPRSRNKQLMRDVLAALSVGLSPIAIFLLVFLLVFLLSITSFLILVLLFMAPYAMGILGAAFSGRKGFDALFPVSIGGVLSIITFFVLFHIIPFLNIWVIFLLLGATTYVVIQKVRMRSR